MVEMTKLLARFGRYDESNKSLGLSLFEVHGFIIPPWKMVGIKITHLNGWSK